MPSMNTLIGVQMRKIASERVTSLNAKTRKALAVVKAQNTKGCLNTAGTVRWHEQAAAARQEEARWQEISRRVQ